MVVFYAARDDAGSESLRFRVVLQRRIIALVIEVITKGHIVFRPAFAVQIKPDTIGIVSAAAFLPCCLVGELGISCTKVIICIEYKGTEKLRRIFLPVRKAAKETSCFQLTQIFDRCRRRDLLQIMRNIVINSPRIRILSMS